MNLFEILIFGFYLLDSFVYIHNIILLIYHVFFELIFDSFWRFSVELVIFFGKVVDLALFVGFWPNSSYFSIFTYYFFSLAYSVKSSTKLVKSYLLMIRQNSPFMDD